MKPFHTLALATLFIAWLAIPAVAEPLSQASAEALARKQLQRLDQGWQDEVWQAATETFQVLNEQTHWSSRQKLIRTLYGPLQTRELKRISYHKTFNLSPDGRYIIIQFQSSYENKAETIETVVLDCSAGTTCPIREYIIQ